MSRTRLFDSLRHWYLARSVGRGFLKNVVVLTSGSVASQLIALLAAPIVTRLYTPDEFGVLGVYLALLSVLSVASTLRFDLAIPMARNDSDAANLVVLVIGISVVINVVLLIAVSLEMNFGGGLVNNNRYSQVLWVMPIGVTFLATYQALSQWFTRKSDFERLARAKVMQSVAVAISQTGLGLYGVGAIGLLVGHMLGHAFAFISLLRKIEKADIAQCSSISWATVNFVGKQYRRFPQYSLVASVLNVLASNASLLIVATLYGPAVAGWLTLTERFILAPINMLGISIGQVAYGELSSVHRTDPGAARKLIYRRFRHLLLLGLGITIALNIVAAVVVPVVFGGAWQNTLVCLHILSPWIIVDFVGSSAAYVLYIYQRQELQLIREVIRITILLITFGLLKYANVDWAMGLAIVSGALLINSLVYLETSRRAMAVDVD